MDKEEELKSLKQQLQTLEKEIALKIQESRMKLEKEPGVLSAISCPDLRSPHADEVQEVSVININDKPLLEKKEFPEKRKGLHR